MFIFSKNVGVIESNEAEVLAILEALGILYGIMDYTTVYKLYTLQKLPKHKKLGTQPEMSQT